MQRIINWLARHFRWARSHGWKQYRTARAAALRARVKHERECEALPGGLFGIYWRGGYEGRDEARKIASQRWDAMLAEADRLTGNEER